MNLKTIVLHARSLTDRPSGEYIKMPIVDRNPYAAVLGVPTEPGLKELEDRYQKDCGQPFKVVNIKNCIIRPAILQTKTTALLYAIDRGKVVPETEWFGYTNFNLNPPTIYYGDWMDADAKRFIIAKEYLSLYAGLYGVNQQQSAGDMIDLARKACDKIIVQPNTDLSTEQSAFYMAIEALIPNALRTQYDWLTKNATLHQTAAAFIVPDEVIAHYQSQTYDESCSYAGLSKMINENIAEIDIQKLTPRKWFKPQF